MGTKQSLLAGHIWSRSLPRFVGGSGESSANVCCSLFAHVIEVVSNRQTDRLNEREGDRDRQTESQTQLAQHRSLAIDMETAVVAPSPSPYGDCGYFSISISVCAEPRNHILSKCLTLSSSVEKACSPTYLSEEDSLAALYRSYSRITHTHTDTR